MLSVYHHSNSKNGNNESLRSSRQLFPMLLICFNFFFFHSQVASVCGLASCGHGLFKIVRKILASLFILGMSIKTINFPPPKHFFAKSILQASWTNEDILNKTKQKIFFKVIHKTIYCITSDIFLDKMKTHRTDTAYFYEKYLVYHQKLYKHKYIECAE